MDKKYFIGILGVSVLIFALAMLIPVEPVKQTQYLPWDIDITPAGQSRVFGLLLGQSTLRQAENHFKSHAQINLFKSKSGQLNVEAYFDKVIMNELSASIVISMQIPPQQLDQMYQRGARISSLGDQRNKITLQSQDLDQVRDATLLSMTYLPRTKLSAALIESRFGQPDQQINEKGNQMVHWLYAKKGLDIALNPDGKAVLQYISPQYFSRVVDPLKRVKD